MGNVHLLPVKRILVIRFSSIGDIVLTTPVLRLLRKRFPEADIRYVTKKQYSSLVKPNKHINGVFELDSSLGDLVKELRAFDPDLVADLHHNLRTRILKTQIGGKWVAFNKLNVAKWLKVNLKVDRLPQQHIVDRYIEPLHQFGIEKDNEGLEFFFDDEFKSPDLSESLLNGFVAVVIGAKYKTKQLPASKLIEICNGLNTPIFLIGGPEDEELGNEILAKSNATVINGCGKYSIQESAWFIKQADLVITHDTGMMHIAAAFQKKIISVWGNTIPQFGMYPYLIESSSQYQAEVNGLSCRPCSKIGFDKCPKGHFKCMQEQDVSSLLAEAQKLLAAY